MNHRPENPRGGKASSVLLLKEVRMTMPKGTPMQITANRVNPMGVTPKRCKILLFIPSHLFSDDPFRPLLKDLIDDSNDQKGDKKKGERSGRGQWIIEEIDRLVVDEICNHVTVSTP